MALPKILGEFRVGQDPDFRFTPGGTPVTSLSVIASSSRKKEDGSWETVDETGWLRVNVWGSAAERVANDVSKGAKIYLVGRYKQRKYTGREGEERTSIEVDADAVEVIPDRRDSTPASGSDAGGQQGDPWAGPPASQNDDPPF